MVTFTINIPQMLAYIPYMDPMGYCFFFLIPYFTATSGHLPELIDIIVAEKAKLFICAVGVPPKWAVDKLHAGGWSEEKSFKVVQGFAKGFSGILLVQSCSYLFMLLPQRSQSHETCLKDNSERGATWWYRYQAIRPAAPLFSSHARWCCYRQHGGFCAQYRESTRCRGRYDHCPRYRRRWTYRSLDK